MSAPRLLLCAPASGGGKTTVTCALLQALVNRGAGPVAFKCGPAATWAAPMAAWA